MKRLMTHVVVGNPTLAATQRLIDAMIRRQVTAIELQIPFSDPIADGPVLMAANDVAVAGGISVAETLDVLRASTGTGTKIYIMSYLQPILHYGPQKFFRAALDAGCSGFIIPDLPHDAPEMDVFVKAIPQLRQVMVPVLSPGMDAERLRAIFQTLQPRLVYLTARQGITGERTAFDNHLQKTIKTIRTRTNAQIAVGFGIQKPADVRAVLRIADLAVAGSVLTAALAESEATALRTLDQLTA